MEIIMLKENFINHISCQQNTLELTSDHCYVYLVQKTESYGWGLWAVSDFIRMNYNCANYM